jgi:flagella basal body P-ring formation protein FlgA
MPSGKVSVSSRLQALACAGALVLLCFAASAGAAGSQDLGAVKKAVEAFVRVQGKELPGRASFAIGSIDPRLHLPPCDALEPFMPAGGRLWGNTTVGVRCAAPASWTVYVPVTVKVTGQVVVTARPLASGQTIGQADLMMQQGELTQLPAGVVSAPEQALGKTVTTGVAAGQPVRLDMLRAPTVVRAGQVVRMVAKGQGFQVSSEGRALSTAILGQTVSVRTSSGQVVSGVAQENGVVEIPF